MDDVTLEVDVNELYLTLLNKNPYKYAEEMPLLVCQRCGIDDDTIRYLPIPIKMNKQQIICHNVCCSFTCLVEYLKEQRNVCNMYMTYSFNILWYIMPHVVMSITA